MDAEPVTIPAALPAARAYEEFFLRYQGWDWFAVVEDDGRFAGLAHRRAVEHAALEEQRSGCDARRRRARRRRGAGGGRHAAGGLLASEPLRRLGALMAVDADGRLRGVVTFEQVTRALRSRLAPLAHAVPAPARARAPALRRRPARSATNASTTAGANCVPACRRSSSIAAASGIPGW